MAIKAVLWDFGGVLTTSPFDAFNKFEEANGVPLDFIRSINATNPNDNAWAQFESNKISMNEFDKLFLNETSEQGYPIKGKEIVAILTGKLRPEMVSVLKKCKETLKVGCITNNLKSGHGASMAADLEQAKEIDAVMDLFDIIVESSKEGVRKPNPKIYEIACRRLGISPNEAIFLDDLGVNLKPARKLGIKTIKVLDVSEAISELSNLTGITF